MTTTPWGESGELKARKLRPGPSASPEDVAANQRERLFGGMVAAVADHGYEATRVADVLEVSGVSRNTFYKHFGNKLECFLATLEAVVTCGGAAVVSALVDHDGSYEDRVPAAFGQLVAAIVAQPAAARLFYVESYAAGPEAIAKVDEFGLRLERLVQQALEASPEHGGLPPELLRAIMRGIRRVIQSRLRAGREAELTEIGPQLLRWAVGYRTPPQPLRHPAEPPPQQFEMRRVDQDDARERIVSAVIELMATKGYRSLTITDIAQEAAISLTTFYLHFPGKDDAVVAALRRATDQVLEVVTPAFRAAPDWPSAVGAGLRAYFAFLVAERPFARFGGVDIHSGSEPVLDVREQLLIGSRDFIAGGYRMRPDVEPIAGEAIAASVDALMFEQITRHGEQRLYEIVPTAIYIALVPFTGIEAACEIANASE